MSIDLIEQARTGDQTAFEQLVGLYRDEVQIHCYRLLGSLAWPGSRDERLSAPGCTGSPPTDA